MTTLPDQYMLHDPAHPLRWTRWNDRPAIRVPVHLAGEAEHCPSAPVLARSGRISRVWTGRILYRFPDAVIVEHLGIEREIGWLR